LTNIDGMIALDMCLQDFLVVGVGKYLISIDVNHAGQLAPPGGFNADNPLECRVEAPVQGVFVAGQHEEEVTELAVSLSGPVRVASASKDGTVSLISQSFLSRRSCNDLHVIYSKRSQWYHIRHWLFSSRISSLFATLCTCCSNSERILVHPCKDFYSSCWCHVQIKNLENLVNRHRLPFHTLFPMYRLMGTLAYNIFKWCSGCFLPK
jgi:hypothetical protein